MDSEELCTFAADYHNLITKQTYCSKKKNERNDKDDSQTSSGSMTEFTLSLWIDGRIVSCRKSGLWSLASKTFGARKSLKASFRSLLADAVFNLLLQKCRGVCDRVIRKEYSIYAVGWCFFTCLFTLAPQYSGYYTLYIIYLWLNDDDEKYKQIDWRF